MMPSLPGTLKLILNKLICKFRLNTNAETNKSISELNSSSSSSNASKWATVVERTNPLENRRWFPEAMLVEKESGKEAKNEENQGTDETPKLSRPTLNNARLISAEEVLESEGPDDWSRLTEFMRTRTVSRPERSRSEPMQTALSMTVNVSKKRKRLPTPE